MAVMSNQMPSAGRRGFFARRTFDTYPQGATRWAMLLLTVAAQVVVYYEFQLGPLLPLLLPSLHISHDTYGRFLAVLLIFTPLATIYGGPLADRYGRVAVIDCCLGIMIVLTFLNLTITGFWSFVVLRMAMGLDGGLIVPALYGLTRDLTPRVNRGLGYSLIVVGAFGSNWLANFVASLTLPIYHTWKSQIWILSFLALAMSLPVLLWLKDLSPEMRLEVRPSEDTTRALPRVHPAAPMPDSAWAAYRLLLSHYEVPVLVLPWVISLTISLLMNSFGPLMLTEAFHYSPGVAARLTGYFWAASVVTLIVVGYLSDQLQLRKSFILASVIAMAALLACWASHFSHPLSYSITVLVCVAGGLLLAASLVPSNALYSMILEDVAPALQSTGWSVFHATYRFYAAIASMLIIYVAARYGWSVPLWYCVAASLAFAAAVATVRSR